MLSEELVTETWQEVAQYSESRARKEMTRFGKQQPYLLAFAAGMVEDLSEEAQEMAIYLLFVVHRMFEKAGTVRQVSGEMLEEQLEANSDLLEQHLESDDETLEGVAVEVSSNQPHVLRYVLEAMEEAAEERDDPEAAEFSEEESGTLFLTLKTVVDVLDRSAE